MSQRIDVKTQDFNESNGLSAYANFIHKDSRDIIWIGTQFGLYRFDGQEFAHFDEKDGLPFRQIMKIFEDTEGWFWLHKDCFSKPNCQENLAFFHPLTKEVLTFEERFGDKVSIAAPQVHRIAQDSGKIYFTANKNLLIWSKEEGIREIPVKGTENTPTLWTKVNENLLGAFELNQIKNGQDVSNHTQYLAIDTNGHIHQQFQLPLDIKSLHVNGFSAHHFELEKIRMKNLEIGKAPDGSITIDTLNFSLPCCPKNGEYADFDQNLFIDKQGRLFHADLGLIKKAKEVYPTGLNLNYNHAGIKKFWLKEKDSPNYFQHFRGYPRHNYFDRETKTAWLALPNGVKTIEYKPKRIKHLKASNQERQLSRSAEAISEHEVVLSIGREGFFYNTQTNELKPFSELSNRDYSLPHRGCAYVVPDKSILWLFNYDSKYRNYGLFKLNTQNAALTAYPLLSQNQKFLPRQMIQIDNHFLIGVGKGLNRYHLSNHALEDFQQYNEFESLKAAQVHFFKQYDEEHFWIGTNVGLFWFSKDKGVLARYGDMETDDFYLPAKEFYHMSEAKGEGYWLATMKGLIHFSVDGGRLTVDGENNQFTSSSVKRSDRLPSAVCRHYQNLSTNEILAAYEDDYGFVWMPTPHGLIQFQISSGLSKTYREGVGLSSKSFQEYAHAQMPDGTLVLGSYKGFNVLHPKDFKDVQFNPEVPLAILDFEQYKANTDSIEYRLKDVIEKGEIILEPGDKFFNIRVALTDYREAERHRFAYKIEGYQEEWQEDKSNLIRISGLPYGNYTLKIKGRLSDAQFSGSVLEVPIEVLRPFYLKAGFIVFALLALATGIFWFLRWRTRQYQIRQKELEIEISKATETIQTQNEELKNLDKLKSRFFANVSHELRTPLTLLLAPIQSVLKNHKLNNKDFTKLTLAKKYGKKLNKMIDEILDLTKLEAGKITLNPTKVVWYNFLRKTVVDFESYANQKNIQFTFHYDGNENLQVELDKKKTEIILMNLLSNAFKFTPKNGKVTIESRDEGQYLVIKVSDTGRGIHPNDLPHIFNRFYQTNQQNTAAEGGTGIGLALSQEFVHLMKGEISVKSDLNKGTEFLVKIPRHEVISQLPTEEAELLTEFKTQGSKFKVQISDSETDNGQPTTDNRQPTLLLVEDNYDLRKFIKNLLEPKYRVLEAENGEEALRRLTVDGERLTEHDRADRPPSAVNRPPNLIISDIMMPVMDGYQLLNVLKSDPKTAGIPVIMLTARGGRDDKFKALRIGVDDYIHKPFDEEELFLRIENLLKNVQNRQLSDDRMPASSESGISGKPSENSEKPTALSGEENLNREWLAEVEKTVIERLSDFDFSVKELARLLAVNRWKLNRQIKQLTGLTADQYIREARLTESRRLLESGEETSVKSVTFRVGLKDSKNFSRLFQKRFGRLPSEYL